MKDKKLQKKLREKREGLVRLSIKKKVGELQDTSRIKKTKKEIARILTSLNK